MRYRLLSIVAATLIGAAVPSITFAQQAQAPAQVEASQKPDVAAIAPITEAEYLKMQIAQLTKELMDANAAKADSDKQRDNLRLQLTLIQAAPVRADHVYDWAAGKFRRISDGMVWDADAKKHVADDKTPKPAEKPKAGGL